MYRLSTFDEPLYVITMFSECYIIFCSKLIRNLQTHTKTKVINTLKKYTNHSDLCHIDTVKIKINTGINPTIKLRPFLTHRKKREMIGKAIAEMLEV